MAINSTFYLDAADLTTATAVYLDLLLVNIAPDGFYGDGTITRQQSLGILLTAEACVFPCLTPCGGEQVNGSGEEGVYIFDLDVGSSLGAVLIKFYPQNIPDGIRATYDGVVYNKLSSPFFGELQSSNYGGFTMVGASFPGSVATCTAWYPSGATLPSLNQYLYNPATDVFDPTGNTQSVTIAVGDIVLTPSSPAFCVMVIPKTSASPNLVNIEILGACVSTSWDINMFCPAELEFFQGTINFATASVPCVTPIDQGYFFVSVQNTPQVYISLYDYIFLDYNGEFPVPDGFYGTGFTLLGNEVIEVSNGIVIGITACI
jgi:hypothetical protein